MLLNHSMLSFMISCKKSDLLSNSFVFSLIALNAKAINSFDEKDGNERADERTKGRESAYELRKKTKMMMKREHMKWWWWWKEDEIKQTKERDRRRNQRMNERKRKKESALVATRSWWCDVLETRCVLSSSKIYEECSSYLVSIRRCLRSFSSASLRDLGSDIANVAEKTSARTMKREERIIADDWWKKLREQRLWSRSSERWWERASWESWERASWESWEETSWESWRRSWRRSWERSWEREFYEYKIR